MSTTKKVKKTKMRMNSWATAAREVYANLVVNDPEYQTFEIRFHNGYSTTVKITHAECVANRLSARDLLENIITDYYTEMEGGVTPQINIIFS